MPDPYKPDPRPTGPNNKSNPYYQKQNHVRIAKNESNRTEFLGAGGGGPVLPNHYGLTVGQFGNDYGFDQSIGNLNPDNVAGYPINSLIITFGGTNSVVYLEMVAGQIVGVGTVFVAIDGNIVELTWNGSFYTGLTPDLTLYNTVASNVGNSLDVDIDTLVQPAPPHVTDLVAMYDFRDPAYMTINASNEVTQVVPWAGSGPALVPNDPQKPPLAVDGGIHLEQGVHEQLEGVHIFPSTEWSGFYSYTLHEGGDSTNCVLTAGDRINFRQVGAVGVYDGSYARLQASDGPHSITTNSGLDVPVAHGFAIPPNEVDAPSLWAEGQYLECGPRQDNSNVLEVIATRGQDVPNKATLHKVLVFDAQLTKADGDALMDYLNYLIAYNL